MIVSGGLILISLALIFIGFVLGIVALKQNTANRWMATAGTIINGVLIVIILFVMVLGLSHKRMPPNNLPEPPPVGVMSPHSRLTVLAARLSFCR